MSSHDRNQEFNYDVDDLIKASKEERRFGEAWEGGKTLRNPWNPILKDYKQRLLDMEVPENVSESRKEK